MMQMLLHGPTRLGRVAGKLRLSHSKSMLRGWLRPTLLSWSASTISRESVHLPINFQPIRPNSTASPATKLHLLRQEFEAAVRRKDAARALHLNRKHEAAEGSFPNRWMYNKLLFLYARKRQVDEAFAVADAMREKGLAPNKFTYAGLLTACAKGEPPPYPLPKHFAHKAAGVFQQMLAAGVQPDAFHFHILMDAQAKAGLADDAFATSTRMQQHGLPPTSATLNILIHACSSACQPLRAMEAVERMTKLPGVKADTVTWNSLLSAFGSRDMDGAYQVWLQMQRSGAVPDHYTLKALATAFQGNATLANELVQEAADARASLLAEQDAQQVSPVGHGKGPKQQQQEPMLQGNTAAGQQRSVRPFLLDLHSLSTSAARMALLKRLEHLTAQHAGSAPQEGGAASARPLASSPPAASRHGDCTRNRRELRDLVIITGAGRHSKAGQKQSLRDITLAVLRAKGLSARQDSSNAGRLVVDRASLSSFMETQRNAEIRSRLLHSAGMRSVLLCVGVASLGAAVYLVPNLLSHSAVV